MRSGWTRQASNVSRSMSKFLRCTSSAGSRRADGRKGSKMSLWSFRGDERRTTSVFINPFRRTSPHCPKYYFATPCSVMVALNCSECRLIGTRKHAASKLPKRRFSSRSTGIKPNGRLMRCRQSEAAPRSDASLSPAMPSPIEMRRACAGYVRTQMFIVSH